MEKKPLIGLILGAIIIVGGGLGIYYGIYLPSQVPGIPAGDAPAGNLVLKNSAGDVVVNLTLSDLVEMVRNETLTLSMSETTIDEKEVTIVGFNPLELLDYYGLNYVESFDFVGSDGFKGTATYDKFYLGDPNYYKDAIGEYSMIAFAVNNKWLAEFDEEYGNLRPFGTLLSGKQKVSDTIEIVAKTELMVNVSLDGVTKFWLTRTNMTTAGLNFTSYEWAYNDTDSGKYWGPADVNGTTIASIATLAAISGNYNVSFISVDGWGTNWIYNNTQMENGLTGKMINDPEEELANEGKQTILNVIEDGDELGYSDGPFRIIMPGQTRDRYQKAVVEIRFVSA